MIKSVFRKLGVLTAVLLAYSALPGGAAAVDAPKWVAALYVDAQKVVGLRWMPVAGATGYKVLRSTTAGAGHEEVAAVAQPQYLDSKIEPGKTFYYVLQAVAGAEASPNSDERSVAIPAEKKVETINAPALVQPTLQESTEFGKTTFKVGLSWTPGAGRKAIAFNVYRSLEAGKGYEMITSTAEQRVTDAKVEEGKTYYYAVSALDETFTESAYSKEMSVAVVRTKRAVEKKVVDKALSIRPTKKVRVIRPPATSKPFNQVGDVTYYDGKIYALDAGNHAVRIFRENGEELGQFGEQGDGSKLGQIKAPTRLTVDADGNFYVTSSLINQVAIFDSSGTPRNSFFLRSKEDQKLPYGAYGAVLRPGKDEIWIGDLDHHLIEIRESDPPFEFLRELRTFKADDQGKIKELGFATPIFALFRPDGKLVVFDALASKLLLFDPDTLELITHGGGIGSIAGTFTRGGGISIDAKGNIYAVDKVMCSIQVFGPDLEFLYILGNEKGDQMEYLSSPLGLTVVENKIFVADRVLGVVVLEMLDESQIVKKEVKH